MRVCFCSSPSLVSDAEKVELEINLLGRPLSLHAHCSLSTVLNNNGTCFLNGTKNELILTINFPHVEKRMKELTCVAHLRLSLSPSAALVAPLPREPWKGVASEKKGKMADTPIKVKKN